MVRFEIKWSRKGQALFGRICGRFGWKDVHLTVNGHCLVNVRDEDLEVFRMTASRHFFSIIEKLEMA